MSRFSTLQALLVTGLVLVGTTFAHADSIAEVLGTKAGGPGGLILLEDDHVEQVVDLGQSDPGTVQVGDVLFGYLRIQQVGQAAPGSTSADMSDAVQPVGSSSAIGEGTQWNELTGIFAVQATSVTTDIVTGAVTITYGAVSTDDDDDFVLGDGATTWAAFKSANGVDDDAVIALFEDSARNYESINSQSETHDTATDGSFIGQIGFTGDGTEFFVNVLEGTNGSFLISLNFIGSFVVGVVPNIEFGTTFYGDGNIQLENPGSLWSAAGDINAAIVIPSPAALPAGLALLGLAAARRRRN